uniref:DNA binding protein n=1 Tax=Microviridae sp. ctkQD1 TaxID=2827648 RepID=A0A8S5S5F4_9VIRU|nr:MAG TPA: DNA binding protein [Microviridae sp. ctkQD1]
MKQTIYAFYDRVAERFLQPIFAINLTTLTRDITDEMSVRTGSAEMKLLRTHPKDFSLHELGQYDTMNGQLTSNGNGPRHILEVLTLQQQPEDPDNPRGNQLPINYTGVRQE